MRSLRTGDDCDVGADSWWLHPDGIVADARPTADPAIEPLVPGDRPGTGHLVSGDQFRGGQRREQLAHADVLTSSTLGFMTFDMRGLIARLQRDRRAWRERRDRG